MKKGDNSSDQKNRGQVRISKDTAQESFQCIANYELFKDGNDKDFETVRAYIEQLEADLARVAEEIENDAN